MAFYGVVPGANNQDVQGDFDPRNQERYGTASPDFYTKNQFPDVDPNVFGAENAAKINGKQTVSLNDPLQWGSKGATWDRSQVDNGNGGFIQGTSGADQDIARYRSMGKMTHAPTQMNLGDANASRAEQMGALGLARDAAQGNAPSAAETYGGRMIDDSINSQMAMANSARGGPAAVAAAQRQAAFQGAQTQQAGARDLAGMRAQEMATARDAYGNMASGIRAGDVSTAQTQAGFDDAAAARDQQNQQYYEQLGWNTNKQRQDAALQQQAQYNDFQLGQREAKRREDSDSWGKVKDVVSGVGGLIGGLTSDERAKNIYSPAIVREDPYGKADPPKASDARARVSAGFSHMGESFGARHGEAYAPRMTVAQYQRPQVGNVLSDERAKDAYSPHVGDARDLDPMADANRSMAGQAYSYKPGFAEASGQAPGEMNYGPMAQRMAADPVASTAVQQDPESGLLTLDRDKLAKLNAAGVASTQRQIDELRAQLGRGGRRG